MTRSSQVCPTESDDKSAAYRNFIDCESDGEEGPVEEIDLMQYGNDEDESPEQLNINVQGVNDACSRHLQAYLPAFGQSKTALQFSQIIEEEGESESGIDNSRCHSRCPSNIFLQK